MVVKFQQNQESGQAGESAMSPRRGFNFSNLYNLNRADDQVANKASQFGAKAGAINNTFQTQNTNAINRGQTTQGSQDAMANAVDQAKNISNQAQNYDPATQARKAGNSAYQSGVASFYAGGSNSDAAQKIRKFGNLYTQSLNKQSDIVGRYNNGQPGKPVGAPTHPDTRKSTYANAQTEQQAVDTRQQDRERAHPRDNQINSMNNLDWGVKTGRITQQQAYRAQNDPAYYQELMKEIE